MTSEFNIVHGERSGIHVIQHNTNDTKTGEKPRYISSGLAFSTDVYHRNNHKDSNQTTMNNMGMERRCMWKEPDNQSSGKAIAKIDRKTAAAASTFRRGDEYPCDSDSDCESDTAYHFSYFVQDGLEDSIM